MGGGSSLHICACVEMCTLIPTHLAPWGGGGEGEFRHARAHKLFKFNFTRRFNTNKRSSIKIASQAPGKLLFIQLSAHRRGFSLPRKDTCVTVRRWFAWSPSDFVFPP